MNQDTQRIEELITTKINECTIKTIRRLGGLTNRTYYVACEKRKSIQEYVVRLPGLGTEKMIVRSDEEKSTKLACKLGIDAHLYFFDSITGEKITEYISNAKTMSVEDLQHKESIILMADTLKKLHHCGENTGVYFNVIDLAETYERVIYNDGGILYDDYNEVKAYINRLKNEYMPFVEMVPCHNDPLCENWMLQNNGKMFLIDWEYAGMNDPIWDLADLSLEADLTCEMEKFFLQSYFGRMPVEKEWNALKINKILIDYLWSLWGISRVIYEGEVMKKYADNRWQRMKKNMKKVQ